jgi:dehydrogenase/reductase SDR family protein 7B
VDIEGNVVWITGASSGIGEALAHEIVALGGKVILSARNEKKLKQIEKNINRGDSTFVLPLNMENFKDFPLIVQRAVEKWGSLDILINNAGISQRSLVSETEPSVVNRIISTNYTGPAILTGLVIPLMQKNKKGHCLFLSSVAGKFATPMRSTYAASKMALQGFSDALRAEVYRDNITVTLVVPGFVKTQISINALEGKGNKHNIMDPNQDRGISSEKAARIIVKGLVKNRREIYCGLVAKTRFALFMARYLPCLLAKIMRTAKVT